MNNLYSWKIPSFAKDVDPTLAVEELKRIESVFGELTAKNILDASRKSTALFHKLFDWNDTTAAEKYRLTQARTILNNIEVHTVSDGKPLTIEVFECITLDNHKVYKNLDSMNVEDISFIKMRTTQEIKILRNKLLKYKELLEVANKLTEALNLI